MKLRSIILIAVIIPITARGETPLNIRVEDLEQAVEYELRRNPKQDMLEVFNQSGFMNLASRVERKLDDSNKNLAEGNELMRSMIRRVEEKEHKDQMQDTLIFNNQTRGVNNSSRIWAIISILSLIFGLIGFLIKELIKAKTTIRKSEPKIKIYKR